MHRHANLDIQDMTYNLTPMTLWTVLEPNLGIYERLLTYHSTHDQSAIHTLINLQDQKKHPKERRPALLFPQERELAEVTLFQKSFFSAPSRSHKSAFQREVKITGGCHRTRYGVERLWKQQSVSGNFGRNTRSDRHPPHTDV